MRFVTGDLFDQDVPAIGHGVNAEGKMWSGIAVDMKNTFSKMNQDYVDLCKNGLVVPGSILPWWSEKRQQWIMNLVTQDKRGANADDSAFAAMNVAGSQYGWGVVSCRVR